MQFTERQITVAYWVATGFLVLFMARSAQAYLTQDAVRVACQRLGFPDYFRIELAVAKLLGGLALVLPVGPRLREWAYAGFGILLVSAIVAHLASGEALGSVGGPGALLGVLGVSYGLGQRRALAVAGRRG